MRFPSRLYNCRCLRSTSTRYKKRTNYIGGIEGEIGNQKIKHYPIRAMLPKEISPKMAISVSLWCICRQKSDSRSVCASRCLAITPLALHHLPPQLIVTVNEIP